MLHTTSITATLFICRAIQIAYLSVRLVSQFLPTVYHAVRGAIAYLVLSGIAAYDTGYAFRGLIEQGIAPAIAEVLNEFCYLINPHLAPAAQPIQYFLEEEPLPTFDFRLSTLIVDPWTLPVAENATIARNNIAPLPRPLLLLPPATEPNNLLNLSIRELKKRASAAKVKNYNVMTKAQLLTALGT